MATSLGLGRAGKSDVPEDFILVRPWHTQEIRKTHRAEMETLGRTTKITPKGGQIGSKPPTSHSTETAPRGKDLEYTNISRVLQESSSKLP